MNKLIILLLKDEKFTQEIESVTDKFSADLVSVIVDALERCIEDG